VPADGVAAARKGSSRARRAGCSSVPPTGIDLVVETAGHAAIEQHVLPALARGTPCMVASVGALSARPRRSSKPRPPPAARRCS
jgi:aspartate dehydrogenase